MSLNPFNMTFPAPSINNTVDLFVYGSSVTNDSLGATILIMIFVVLFIGFRAWPTASAFSTSIFLTTIGAFMLSILGLISPEIIIILTVLTAMSVLLAAKFGN